MANLKLKVKVTPKTSMKDVVEKDLAVRLYNAAKQTEGKLKDELANAMDARWQWPRGGPRDIVDTGDLKKSCKILTGKSGKVVFYEITYALPYAAITYHGGYILPYGNPFAQRVYLPPRPWIDAKLVGGYSGISVFNLGREIGSKL